MIKLIVSDLDRTLLHQSVLSSYSKDVLNRLMAKGIMFVPCSARTLFEIDDWFKENKDIDYIGCSNGSIIYNNKSEEIEVSHMMKASKIKLILDKVSKVNNWWTIVVDDKMYSSKQILVDREYLKISDSNTEHLISSRIFVEDYTEVLERNDEVNKLHFITEFPEDKVKLVQELKEYEKIYKITSSSVHNVELTDLKASKGTTVEWMMNKFQLNANEVMVFGDNDNDASMFEIAGNKVAIKSASEYLNALKSDTCDDAINDGVAHYIEDNLL